MSSRFSTLQRRNDGPERSPEPPAPHDAGSVLIPTLRKPAPSSKTELSATAAKTANKVLEARSRIHRMLLEEINLVALERLPREDMHRQVHDFVSEKTRQERMAINVAELDG